MLRRKKRDKDEIDLKREVKDRRAVEDEQPWFLTEDDGPELEVETNRSFRPPEDL
ncbi:MAG TPA: hypothetical protein VFV00_05935 [Acidimicrobiales bacterium]|nr:hypothetical protein [Acidimicrobiales bacterium]